MPGEDTPHVTEANLIVEEVSGDQVTGLAQGDGVVAATVRAGSESRTGTQRVSGVPAPFAVSGRWRLVLEGKDFARTVKTLTHLASWTKDPDTKHFSGTGRYDLDFSLPEHYLDEDLELILDLGRVGDIADVELNGKKVGVAWMRPYRLDITSAAQKGSNHVTVLVTNTLINRVAGFKEAPPVPEELVPHYGSGSADYARGREVPEIGFQPLSPSGLMGPVTIYPLKRVSIGLGTAS